MHQVVDHHGDHRDEEHDGDCGAIAKVAVGEELAVELRCHYLRAVLAAGHDDDHIENLQGEDGNSGGDGDDGALDIGNNNTEESPATNKCLNFI